MGQLSFNNLSSAGCYEEVKVTLMQKTGQVALVLNYKEINFG